MTWLDWSTRVTRYTGPKLQPHRTRLESPGSSGEELDECAMVYLIEGSRWRDSRVRDAREYLTSLESDPDADDFAIAWARHELLRCVQAAKDDVLRNS
jgi:hypothetical protein